MAAQNIHKELSYAYIRGEGIEIGTLHQSLPVPPNVTVHYVDRRECVGLPDRYSGCPKDELTDHQGPDDAGFLKTIPDGSFDFCICRHVFEHLGDPAGSFLRLMRILRPGGIFYLSFPDAANPQIRQLSEYVQSRGIGCDILKRAEDETSGVRENIFIIEKTGYVEEIFRILENTPQCHTDTSEKTDVIVPIYNAYEDTCRCLYSLLKFRNNYRIVLVNDCSTDERIPALLERISRSDIPCITIITNPENHGFVRSVNTGMRFSGNDVILLNSDTIVTEKWAEKIRDCAYSDDRIATVTPFTNNGTICSIPEFCSDNQIPQGYTIDSFGRFVEELSFRHYPEIPTAVGFCMYIRRDVLEKTGFFDEASFDKGYCEENDFCMRAIRAGYTNRLCDDTFVYHKGESSFCGTRNARVEKNFQILAGRYPEYVPLVQRFCATNPLLDQQSYFKAKIAVWSDPRTKKRILYILHSLGGGTEKHAEDLISSLCNSYAFFIAQVFQNTLIFTEINNGTRIRYRFPMKSFGPHTASDPGYRDIMKKFIAAFSIDLIHVHHLMGHSFDIFKTAEEMDIPVLFTVHDFFSICPKINLLDENGRYCGIPEIPVCNRCLKKTFNHGDGFISAWRSLYQEGLGICDQIIAPSKAAIEILTRCYPELKEKCSVIEHGSDPIKPDHPAYGNADGGDRVFHIAYIGILAFHKGREVFYTLAQSRDLAGITKWSILGVSDLHKEAGYYPKNNVTVHGPYTDLEHLRKLTIENNIDLIILPALWPETFSFTLSEAWELGIPVLGSDLGAIGERIRETGGGWTVDIHDIGAVKSMIRKIIGSPEEYQKVKDRIKTIRPLSMAVVAKRYDQLYKKKIRKARQDRAPEFGNAELYTSMQSDTPVAEPAAVPGNRVIQPMPRGNLFQQCMMCLHENGVTYTIRRIWVYCSGR
jgi:O-antigen biosynthesis protein